MSSVFCCIYVCVKWNHCLSGKILHFMKNIQSAPDMKACHMSSYMAHFHTCVFIYPFIGYCGFYSQYANCYHLCTQIGNLISGGSGVVRICVHILFWAFSSERLGLDIATKDPQAMPRLYSLTLPTFIPDSVQSAYIECTPSLYFIIFIAMGDMSFIYCLYVHKAVR